MKNFHDKYNVCCWVYLLLLLTDNTCMGFGIVNDETSQTAVQEKSIGFALANRLGHEVDVQVTCWKQVNDGFVKKRVSTYYGLEYAEHTQNKNVLAVADSECSHEVDFNKEVKISLKFFRTDNGKVMCFKGSYSFNGFNLNVEYFTEAEGGCNTGGGWFSTMEFSRRNTINSGNHAGTGGNTSGFKKTVLFFLHGTGGDRRLKFCEETDGCYDTLSNFKEKTDLTNLLCWRGKDDQWKPQTDQPCSCEENNEAVCSNGKCTDLNTNDDHCGVCENSCNNQKTCYEGRCKLSCSSSPNKPNGSQYSPSQDVYIIDDRVDYSCKTGYTASNTTANYRGKCRENGGQMEWRYEPDVIQCIENGCTGSPSVDSTGRGTWYRNSNDNECNEADGSETCTFRCPLNWIVSGGSDTRQCIKGDWESGQDPRCERDCHWSIDTSDKYYHDDGDLKPRTSTSRADYMGKQNTADKCRTLCLDLRVELNINYLGFLYHTNNYHKAAWQNSCHCYKSIITTSTIDTNDVKVGITKVCQDDGSSLLVNNNNEIQSGPKVTEIAVGDNKAVRNINNNINIIPIIGVLIVVIVVAMIALLFVYKKRTLPNQTPPVDDVEEDKNNL